MSAFGNRLGLVGFTTGDEPVGRWFEKEFDGVTYKFFSIAKVYPTAKQPFIPLRITSFFQFRKHLKAIMSLGVHNAFTQAPETYLSTIQGGWKSYCFAFPGIENILNMSRYKWARPLAMAYEKHLARQLLKANLIIAAADGKEIAAFAQRVDNIIPASRVISFPTRVDTTLFHPVSRPSLRQELNLPDDVPVIVSCARISRRKGWDLVLDAFKIFIRNHAGARLIYIGDGEDRVPLEAAIQEAGLGQNVSLIGFKPPSVIALYNSTCDVFVNGSHFEGWPVAQLEAIACGAPLVSTDVSGARDLIHNGENGYLVMDRSPQSFCDAMTATLALPNARAISAHIAQDYAVSNLAASLGAIWPPVAGSHQ
jgi:glycosyltransferase involved in cell wall biosynthesis